MFWNLTSKTDLTMEKSMGARVNNELEACYRLRSFGGKQTSADLPQRNAVSVQRLGGP